MRILPFNKGQGRVFLTPFFAHVVAKSAPLQSADALRAPADFRPLPCSSSLLAAPLPHAGVLRTLLRFGHSRRFGGKDKGTFADCARSHRQARFASLPMLPRFVAPPLSLRLHSLALTAFSRFCASRHSRRSEERAPHAFAFRSLPSPVGANCVRPPLPFLRAHLFG